MERTLPSSTSCTLPAAPSVHRIVAAPFSRYLRGISPLPPSPLTFPASFRSIFLLPPGGETTRVSPGVQARRRNSITRVTRRFAHAGDPRSSVMLDDLSLLADDRSWPFCRWSLIYIRQPGTSSWNLNESRAHAFGQIRSQF